MSNKDTHIKSIPLPELPLDWIRNTELLEVPEGARRLLEEYGKIPHNDVMQHINQVVSLYLHGTALSESLG